METIIIEPTPAGTFSAYAPDVPGCVATDRIRSGEDPGRLVEKCLYRVPLAYLAGLVGLAFALGFVVRGVV